MGVQAVTVATWPAPSGTLPLKTGELTWLPSDSTGVPSIWAAEEKHTRLVEGRSSGTLSGRFEATVLACGMWGTCIHAPGVSSLGYRLNYTLQKNEVERTEPLSEGSLACV